MFLTKYDLKHSLKVLELYEEDLSADKRTEIANEFAREVFNDFDVLEMIEQEEIVEMILSDIDSQSFGIN
jgi:hypothetical protein